MSFIAAIGTYVPWWNCDVRRIVGDDEGAITLAEVTSVGAALPVNPGAVSVVTVFEGLVGYGG